MKISIYIKTACTKLCMIITVFILSISSSNASDPEHEMRVGRVLAASCASCHGTHGNAIDNMPKLAGMTRDSFIDSMMDFKSNKRSSTVMHQISKGYTDEQIELLADYFSNQELGGAHVK